MAQCTRTTYGEGLAVPCGREAVLDGLCWGCFWVEHPGRRGELPERVKAKRAAPKPIKETAFVHGLIKLLNHLQGIKVYRNNSGKWVDAKGNHISYGVGKPGGSDLLGWRSVLITQSHVGLTMAQFVAIECKAGTGKLSDDQRDFLKRVNDAGGLGLEAHAKDGYEVVKKLIEEK